MSKLHESAKLIFKHILSRKEGKKGSDCLSDSRLRVQVYLTLNLSVNKDETDTGYFQQILVCPVVGSIPKERCNCSSCGCSVVLDQLTLHLHSDSSTVTRSSESAVLFDTISILHSDRRPYSLCKKWGRAGLVLCSTPLSTTPSTS